MPIPSTDIFKTKPSFARQLCFNDIIQGLFAEGVANLGDTQLVLLVETVKPMVDRVLPADAHVAIFEQGVMSTLLQIMDAEVEKREPHSRSMRPAGG